VFQGEGKVGKKGSWGRSKEVKRGELVARVGARK
jgi:hypothetical protein